jgi:LPXTG-motif cell wall-anchored protein
MKANRLLRLGGVALLGVALSLAGISASSADSHPPNVIESCVAVVNVDGSVTVTMTTSGNTKHEAISISGVGKPALTVVTDNKPTIWVATVTVSSTDLTEGAHTVTCSSIGTGGPNPAPKAADFLAGPQGPGTPTVTTVSVLGAPTVGTAADCGVSGTVLPPAAITGIVYWYSIDGGTAALFTSEVEVAPGQEIDIWAEPEAGYAIGDGVTDSWNFQGQPEPTTCPVPAATTPPPTTISTMPSVLATGSGAPSAGTLPYTGSTGVSLMGALATLLVVAGFGLLAANRRRAQLDNPAKHL